MNIKSIQNATQEVSNHFFDRKQGHLDDKLSHISMDEIRYNLRFKSEDFSLEAKMVLESLLYRNTFVTIQDFHSDDNDGISSDDLEQLILIDNDNKVEDLFKPLLEINILDGAKDYGINTRENIHDVEVITINNERKIIYVARGRDGYGPTGFWMGNLEDDFGQQYISLEGLSLNNADFRGMDAVLENNELKLTILNIGTSNVNIRRITNNLFEFNIGGRGEEEVYYIIVYNRDEEKKYYDNIPRKFFIHISDRNKYFNKDDRLIAIRLNNNSQPNRVILPFSLEELRIKNEDLSSFFLDKNITHTTYTDDGVMMGISSFPGVDRDQFSVYSLLSEADNRAIVTTNKGLYIFGQFENKQLIFFRDKKNKVSFLDKGIDFGNIFGEQNARIIGATNYENIIVLLVESLERKEGITHRSYYISKIKEDNILHNDFSKISPIKLSLSSLSLEASLRGISIDNGIIYLLSDDPIRDSQGSTQEYMVHEISEINSEIILKDNDNE
jgi:hypothetical protein